LEKSGGASQNFIQVVALYKKKKKKKKKVQAISHTTLNFKYTVTLVTNNNLNVTC
jgi:hypothetical protein